MADTSIEWATKVWNPTTGCDRVSPGCDHCYALTLAKRLKAMGSAKYQTDGNPQTSGPGFGLATHPHALSAPLAWRQPERVFVNSMSDLFHDQVPEEFIARVFAVMALAQRHTFQLLTKRHGRMRSLLSSGDFRKSVQTAVAAYMVDRQHSQTPTPAPAQGWLRDSSRWPLPNVHLVVSVEDQHWANIRIPVLLDTPAAVRGISVEPMLGPVRLSASWINMPPEARPVTAWDLLGVGLPNRLDWIVCGGESGPGSRPMLTQWARSLRDQCVASGTPFFFKQFGDHVEDPAGNLMSVVDTEGHEYVTRMRRVGKKAAGRMLDGRTWDQYPEVAGG